MDIVTITCGRDRGIQELQSYSLNLMVEASYDHYVVIEDKTLSIDEWDEILSPYYTNHKLHIVPSMVPEKYYKNDSRIKNGWHRSAILKLLIAEKVTSPRYLILDSKNIFIKPQNIDEWPIKDGNGIVENYTHRSWKEVNEFCTANGISVPTEMYMSATPFVVDTKIVKKIINFDIFPLFFDKKEWWSSELLLYSIFTHHCGNPITNERIPNITFWNSERELDKATLLDVFDWPNMRMFGLHRGIIELNRDLGNIIDFLVDKGYDRNILMKTLDIYKQDINGKK
jgi:hypothetical protein